MNKITQFTAALLFLIILFGKINPLAAQADFSNWIITTDCCPKEKNRIDSIINNAPFVFEGRMIKWSPGLYYDSYLFEIEKIYRGGEQLQAGTVEIISKLPNEPSDPSPANFGYSRYIIFAKEINSITVRSYERIDEYGRIGNINIFNIDTLGVFDANNSIKLEVFYNDYFSITSCIRELDDYYRSEFALNFKTRKELLDFLSRYGLSPTDIPKLERLKGVSYPFNREESGKKRYRALIEEQWKFDSISGKTVIRKDVEDAMQEYENASDSVRNLWLYKRMDDELRQIDSVSKANKSKSRGQQKSGNANLTVSIRNVRDFVSSGNILFSFCIII